MQRHIFSRTAIIVAATAAVAVPAASGVRAAAAQARSASRGSTIIYSCKSGHTICTYNPVTHKRRTLQHRGYLAGITTSGATYGYVSASTGEIYEAPVKGGRAKVVSSQKQASPLAVMSPDGRHFLEQLTLTDPYSQFVIEYNVAKGPKSHYTSLDSDTTATMTYGFLRDTVLTAHSAEGFTPPSWVCIGHQHGFCGDGKTRPQIDAKGANLTFPSGSANGKEVVTSFGTAATDVGRYIAIFSATSGKLIRSPGIKANKGYGIATPRFSPNGKQIVFSLGRVNASGDPVGTEMIYTINANAKNASSLRKVGTGTNPFWGGA
jgi:hypothetical protein